jgi:putative membrane protein
MHQKNKINIAIFIAILFHLCGAIGILFTPYKDWFINLTPLNLLLMAALLVFTQPQKNKFFFLFIAIAFVMGMLSEIIGVNTHRIFGDYSYGEKLGIKFMNVPLIIGIQWFMTMYCSGIIAHRMYRSIIAKYKSDGMKNGLLLMNTALIFDGIMLALLLDHTMEPIAQRMGLWAWANNEVPVFNYICWFAIGGLLLFIFGKLKFNKDNEFAIHLFIIQLLFFLALGTKI